MRKFIPLFSATLFLSLHYATTLYVNSAFLASFLGVHGASLMFLAGAVLNVIFFMIAPLLVKHLGARPFFLIFSALTIAACIVFAYPKSIALLLVWFLIYSITLPMIYYALDIFLEDISLDKHTGFLRGAYLTCINIAIAVAPLSLVLASHKENVSAIYLISFFLLLPILPLFFYFEEPHFRHHLNSALPLREWWRSHNLRYATIARLALETFYAVMVIYTPLYLHEVLQFSWGEIGIMFPIMLVPFVLLEWPIGILADKKFGEKEFMSAGFFIAGSSLLIMPFLGAGFLIWTLALFVSRVGACFIEITTETYFFKKVNSSDRGLIAIFRLTRSFAFICGAAIGLVTLAFAPIENIFFVLAVFMLLGLISSARIKDTL